ncbi:hypothetical protein FACS18949_04690 [Clostridia bacterium]|nr:hypothetical protein FACS189425_08600 [Clostridia bacterium]GHV32753.1 hypothetical protein FACS18949_04690 [Clostridia bacterium]
MKKVMFRVIAAVLAVVVIWVGMALFYVRNQSAIMGSLYSIKHEMTGFPQGEIVLLGSSSIQIWNDSEWDLAPFKTTNVGISGSIVKDWFPLVDKLIVPFHPKAVLVYVGSNDIHALNRTPEDVAADAEKLLDDIHAKLPNAVLYYVSVYTSENTAEMRPQDERMNELTKAMTERKGYRFIDVASSLLNADGSLRQDVFLFDNVHLNKTGYALWAPVVRAAFGEDFKD